MAIEDLGCVIYADAPRERVVRALDTLLDGGEDGMRARAGGNEVDVVRNLDHDLVLRSSFPDGWLHFAARVELFPDEPAPTLDDQVGVVTGLLQSLWVQGIPAVAACDYEDRLPYGGGGGSRAIPWPT